MVSETTGKLNEGSISSFQYAGAINFKCAVLKVLATKDAVSSNGSF